MIWTENTINRDEIPAMIALPVEDAKVDDCLTFKDVIVERNFLNDDNSQTTEIHSRIFRIVNIDSETQKLGICNAFRGTNKKLQSYSVLTVSFLGFSEAEPKKVGTWDGKQINLLEVPKEAETL